MKSTGKMVSKTVIGIAAGIAGTLFVGYCIYFDRKRRSDPQFRQKLKERREKQKSKQKQKDGSSSTMNMQLPNMADPQQVQQYFLTQVQRGEELLAQGDLDNGTECLCHAVSVCGQPAHLLEVLQRTLPLPVYNLLVEKLPAVNDKVSTAIAAAAASGMGGASSALVEEELE
ncbi:mitochondrial import receptor subunit TOM20 homolog [Acanthaster planci]|uniref:Mitochondrial import receptor subunit TOM20 homolog n=1 Tax=Acanthaster planci TaxID=133434 RepID=A0A8B7YEG5_ACAPL|nr:mitochondrial import receptor subunit TOM20 homolog [Acanthaster planci]